MENIWTSWIQLGFAGFCLVLMVVRFLLTKAQFDFSNETITHLRRTENERCLRHSEDLKLIAETISQHTQNSIVFHESVSKEHKQAQIINEKLLECLDKLTDKISAQVLLWRDSCEVLTMMREQLKTTLKSFDSGVELLVDKHAECLRQFEREMKK